MKKITNIKNIFQQRIIFKLLLVALATLSIPAQSALSPTSVNLRDLNSLVNFIEQHPKVADTLQRIDFSRYTIVFDDGCEAYFVRGKTSLWSKSMPGPQPGIVFKKSTCSLNYKK